MTPEEEKNRKIHLLSPSIKQTACGTSTGEAIPLEPFLSILCTDNPQEVTCGKCKRTHRFKTQQRGRS